MKIIPYIPANPVEVLRPRCGDIGQCPHGLIVPLFELRSVCYPCFWRILLENNKKIENINKNRASTAILFTAYAFLSSLFTASKTHPKAPDPRFFMTLKSFKNLKNGISKKQRGRKTSLDSKFTLSVWKRPCLLKVEDMLPYPSSAWHLALLHQVRSLSSAHQWSY